MQSDGTEGLIFELHIFPSIQVPMGAGPDRPHEELHRALRPRLRQAGEAGAVQGEDTRQDGRRRTHRKGGKCVMISTQIVSNIDRSFAMSSQYSKTDIDFLALAPSLIEIGY